MAACTTLREHRGDGHIAILMAEQVSPVQAHLIKLASGESAETPLRSSRSFADDEWAAVPRPAVYRAADGWTASHSLPKAAARTHGSSNAQFSVAALPWHGLAPRAPPNWKHS